MKCTDYNGLRPLVIYLLFALSGKLSAIDRQVQHQSSSHGSNVPKWASNFSSFQSFIKGKKKLKKFFYICIFVFSVSRCHKHIQSSDYFFTLLKYQATGGTQTGNTSTGVLSLNDCATSAGVKVETRTHIIIHMYRISKLVPKWS